MGGAARAAHEQAQALASYFNVHNAVFNDARPVEFPSELPLISLGNSEISRPGFLRPIFNLLHRACRLRRVKTQLSTQLTISHLDGANRVSVLSGGRDVKILVAHGSLAHDRSQGPIKGLLARRILVPFLYNRSDRVVAVSRHLAEELVSLGVNEERITYINNFFNIDSILAQSKEPLSQNEKTIFSDSQSLITVGRLHEHKNPIGLINIFAQLRKSEPVKLVFIGDGPLRLATIRRAEELGLRTFTAWRNDRLDKIYDVYLLGTKTNPFKYVASGTIFVLPSMQEGFPLALCEALACGIPVVAADCPTGPREILAPRTGIAKHPIQAEEISEFGVLLPLLRNGNSTKAWVATLSRLLGDPGERLRLAEAGRIRVQDFTPEKIIPMWLNLIAELLRTRV